MAKPNYSGEKRRKELERKKKKEEKKRRKSEGSAPSSNDESTEVVPGAPSETDVIDPVVEDRPASRPFSP